MISMDFLKNIKVGGLEFIDFQNGNFCTKLTSHLEEHINEQGILSKDSAQGIKDIIKEFTGFKNLNIVFVDSGNLSVDLGYFSPKHVLNSDYADELLKVTDSTLYRWFTQNSSKVFQGGIDYRTGRVLGSFQTLPIEMRINANLYDFLKRDRVIKYGVPLPGLVSGLLAHEMGHPFGACMMLATLASDNILARAALRHYTTAKTTEERVVVLQDTASLLDLDKGKLSDLQAIAKNADGNAMILYFSKLQNQRNTKRSLSVGVTRMSSEVIADMYAIRMGCDKTLIAVIGNWVDTGAVESILNHAMAATIATLVVTLVSSPSLISLAIVGAPSSFFLIGGLAVFTTLFVIDYFLSGYSGTYNADHRRFEDAVRQLITKLKEDKTIPPADKANLIKEVDALLEVNKKLKPWYDSTVVGRMFGWLFSGSDFKLQEMEHYTNVLANHEINLLPSQLQALR